MSDYVTARAVFLALAAGALALLGGSCTAVEVVPINDGEGIDASGDQQTGGDVLCSSDVDCPPQDPSDPCSAGTCTAGLCLYETSTDRCTIGDQCVSAGSPVGDDPCVTCQPTVSVDVGTAVTCGAGQHCVSGGCEPLGTPQCTDCTPVGFVLGDGAARIRERLANDMQVDIIATPSPNRSADETVLGPDSEYSVYFGVFAPIPVEK